MTTELLDKYNVQGPDTSYRPRPSGATRSRPEYEAACVRANAAGRPVSLYVHLPFCDEQCWFCGCFMKVVRSRTEGRRREEIEGTSPTCTARSTTSRRRSPATGRSSRSTGRRHADVPDARSADRPPQHLLEAFPPAPNAEVRSRSTRA